MIYTSSLPNDQDMIRALGGMAMPVPLDIGDCCFSGVGADELPIVVAVERKKIGDLAQCVLDGRYLAQAQKSVSLGADVLVLVVEGIVRPNPDDGLLEIKVWGVDPRTLRRREFWRPVKPTTTYSRFDQYLTELDHLLGVMVKRTVDVRETAAVIKALWSSFQRPPDGHQSLKTIYRPQPQRALLVKPSLVRRVASELPGIGWERSAAVAEQFRSVQEMVEASLDDWIGIEGIGPVTAGKVMTALWGFSTVKR